MITPFPEIQLDRFVRVAGIRNRSLLNFSPDPPQGVKLTAGVVTWEEPKEQANITHYIIRISNDAVFAKVPVGQVSIDGVIGTQVFVTSFNAESGLESRQISTIGTGVPVPPTPGPSGAAWTPYTPTTTHLSSTTKDAAGIQGGKSAYVRIEVIGTSDGTAPTITLPYAPLNTKQTFACTITNAGATIDGVAVITSGSTLTIGTYNNTALTNGQVYTIRVQGVYETA